jgi:hypothetical protein
MKIGFVASQGAHGRESVLRERLFRNAIEGVRL